MFAVNTYVKIDYVHRKTEKLMCKPLHLQASFGCIINIYTKEMHLCLPASLSMSVCLSLSL